MMKTIPFFWSPSLTLKYIYMTTHYWVDTVFSEFFFLLVKTPDSNPGLWSATHEPPHIPDTFLMLLLSINILFFMWDNMFFS